MKENQLTLSIVIPAYNEERHLKACLDSIARQTVRPDEVIVVDNNSHDRTAEIAHRYSFVRVVREDRPGLVHARNRGFDAATTDIIGRIDADTTLPETWVQHIKLFYANPKNQQKAWSGSGYFYNVRLPGLVAWAYQFMAFRFNQLLLGHYTLWGSNMALPRRYWTSVRDKICGRRDIHEDLDLALHVAEAGVEIVYDRAQPVHAELRRVNVDRHRLWEYLQWWPRTLKVHGKKNWVICWFFGALLLYVATFILLFLEVLSRSLKKFTSIFTSSTSIASQDLQE